MIILMTTTCSKCNGLGKVRAFGHVENGRCFSCGGAGQVDASMAKRTAHCEMSDAEKAAYDADKRAVYLRHYRTTAARVPGLTLAEFKRMALPHAEDTRVESGYADLNAYCWASGAGWVALEG